MNQILTTEKVYMTPQLKRKKRFFKIEFFLSVLLLCLIIAFYIYVEIDKSKSEEVGKMMLESATELQAMTASNKKDNNESLSEEEYNVWTFVLEETTDRSNGNKQTNSRVADIIIPEQPMEEEEEETTVIEREVYYDSEGEPYTVIAILYIPALESEFAILSRTTDELLKINPTKFEGYEKGPEPNQVGNLCIVGHNYRDTRFFSQVPDLELGETITLTDNYGKTVTYVMYDKYNVEPTDLSCLSQDTHGRREVTLITCTYDGSERVIAKFKEQK